jgi:hypothetical protein
MLGVRTWRNLGKHVWHQSLGEMGWQGDILPVGWLGRRF